MGKFLRKLQVLVWKSFVVRKCHWIITLLELCVPFALFIGLAILNSYATKDIGSIDEQVYPKQTEEYVTRHLTKDAHYLLQTEGCYLMYTPVNEVTTKLMQMTKRELLDNAIKDIHGMKSEADMEVTFKQLTQNNSNILIFGIVFQEDMTQIPLKTLNYKIRSNLRTTDLFVGLFGGATPESYIDQSFLALQITLDRCFMKFIGKESNAKFSVQKFPMPAMKANDVKTLIHELLSLTTILSFIFLCPGVLKRVVEEKQSGVKELMKLMGLPPLLLWIGWFVHAMSIAVISIAAITIIVGIPFNGSEPVLLCSGIVVWIFLLLYCTAIITSLFAISALFKRPTLAMVFGLLVWIGTYIASKFIIGSRICFFSKILSALLPNIALSWGFNAIIHYEKRELVMSLADVVSPSISMGDDFHLWQVWIILAVQAAFYFIFAMYLEAIFPGDYGVAKPWYFPLMGCLKCVRVAPQSDMKNGGCEDAESFEPLAASLPIGIKVRKLRKEFKSPWSRETKTAVDGLSLDICREQITALLGHNGAGKSTTMMILTGMLSPTSGTVEINGYDIKYHMSKVRESLGLCPQHNLLFPDLTVQQHLTFFAMLKCGPDQNPDEEVALYAEKLNLISHLHKKPDALSGGYKRRLCLALAFIGDSKTVILDEPTSGLDPEARREIWDLLLSMRGSRTILITTHIMEEADVLGDRIAIMDHGLVQCYGTPMYLKKLYGTGYVLNILKNNSGNADAIQTAVERIIPGAELKTCVASLMTFSLPDEKRSSFPELFALLQRERNALGIESVGVSITTLEEVFVRVGEIALEEAGKNEDLASEVSDKSECSMQPLSPYSVKGVHLFLQQVEALLRKRVRVMNCSYLIHLVLSVSVIILVTALSLRPFGGSPLPPIQLDLSQYGKTNVLYSSADGVPESFINGYVTAVKQSGSKAEQVPPGVNVTTALLKKAYEDKEAYIFNYIVAARLNQPNGELIALYSDVALHSLPISVNLLENALLKYEGRDNDYGISITNHPFQQEEPMFLPEELVTLLWMALVPLALTFWMGLFVILPMQERVSSSRQLQCMTGVKVPTYWFTLYIWDLFVHCILSSFLILAVLFVDRVGVFSDTAELGNLFLIFFLYGMSAIPFSYLVSFWKDTWAGCYSLLVIINIVAGLIMAIIMDILHSVAVSSAQGLQGVIRLVPNFAFTQVLQKFVTQVLHVKDCLRITDAELKQKCSRIDLKCCTCVGKECYTTEESYMEKNQDLLLYLGLTWILYMFLVIAIDMGIFEWMWAKILSLQGISKSSERSGNDDVDGEAEHVEKFFEKNISTAQSADLLVNNLKKKYGILPKPLAVKGVSFHVKPGECFGLLGVNGAGKTTTFKMLTGAVMPTQGVAAIAGYRSDKHKCQYLSQIGYCPQHDALIECLTAVETLQLYGTLRGVPKNKIDREVDHWIRMMGLKEYRDKKCGTYSGGNKRKLMTAMALIGSPPLVFLDEPTSGVDPVARRNLWNSLICLQKGGQSIVLTSHSMEECEALCNRLGIMVDGQLVCMGNIPHLKNKYKQGSTVKIKLKAGSGQEYIKELQKKMGELFSQLVLKDEHETLLHYHVTDPNVSWGFMFETMETLKESCSILEDYTISETTLEEVFLSFAQT